MPNVLILGARAPAALDHARRFAHQGWRVIVGDSVSCRLSGWSRAVQATLALPSARFAPQAYAQALNAAVRAHRIDLVVPTCEEAFFVAHGRHQLPASVRVAVADFATMRELHSKWRFLELARQCGAMVPDSARVRSLDEARAWAMGEAVVLKPEYSRFGVHVRLYPEGIPVQARPFEQPGDWVVQRFCRGTELCSYSILDAGRLRAHVSYRPSYRIEGSSSFFFQPHESAPIRTFVEALGWRTGYTGQIAFDWIEGADGRVHVLECNPRAVSGVHLFDRDATLPAALAGEGEGCVVPTMPAPRMIAPVMLLAGSAQAFRAGALGTWWRDLRQARDVVAHAGDRKPVLGGLVDLCVYARMALDQRCTLREASTRDIEWDGEPLEVP